MTASAHQVLTADDISLTAPAEAKIAELFKQIEEEIQGVRVYATPGGCSGVSFGMTFTDQILDNDAILQCSGFKVIVDHGALPMLRGVEIDYADRGDGNSVFMFNNLQPAQSSGCGGCSSASSCGS